MPNTNNLLFTPPETPELAVKGQTGTFPVGRVFCVGRNYDAHALEMGDTSKKPPFFFTKFANTMVQNKGKIPYPPHTKELHHEVELVAFLHKGGANLTNGQALDCIFGYATGVDLTRRDVQAKAKEQGKPWALSKGFDYSAPVGIVTPVASGFNPNRGNIALSVNGKQRQSGNLSDMIWSAADIIAKLSEQIQLQPGDAIMTGTPAGVGPLQKGDTVTAGIEGLAPVGFAVE